MLGGVKTYLSVHEDRGRTAPIGATGPSRGVLAVIGTPSSNLGSRHLIKRRRWSSGSL